MWRRARRKPASAASDAGKVPLPDLWSIVGGSFIPTTTLSFLCHPNTVTQTHQIGPLHPATTGWFLGAPRIGCTSRHEDTAQTHIRECDSSHVYTV